ncbi:LysR substrate-binding domain-containing protein [Bacillaceae bacterium S4-13-58]
MLLFRNKWFSKNLNFNSKKTRRVDQIETCKQLMMNGLGMAILPETSIKNLGQNFYHKERLELNGELLKRDTWVCYSTKAKELPQVRAFLKMIEEN